MYVSVTVPPTSTLPKFVDEPVAGASASPAAACPSAVAVNVTDPPGVPDSVSVPVREPLADGLKATPIVHVAPPARGTLQVFDVTRTSSVLLLVKVGVPVGTSPLLTMIQLDAPEVLPTTIVP